MKKKKFLKAFIIQYVLDVMRLIFDLTYQLSEYFFFFFAKKSYRYKKSRN